MNGDRLRFELENALEASIHEKITAYEELLERADVSRVERFEDVVFEVKRRIKLTQVLAKDAGLEGVARRAKVLLNKFDPEDGQQAV